MTWFSEYSASPRRRLASSAIRCPSVDRFVGFSVPSRVSGQRSSPRGASLPSAGSRRARFPDVRGTMKSLRLPACAYPVPYGFGSRLHVLLRVRVRHGAPAAAKVRSRWGIWSAGLPSPAACTWHARGLSGFLALRPTPLPGSPTPAGPAGPRLYRSCRCCPRDQYAEGSSKA